MCFFFNGTYYLWYFRRANSHHKPYFCCITWTSINKSLNAFFEKSESWKKAKSLQRPQRPDHYFNGHGDQSIYCKRFPTTFTSEDVLEVLASCIHRRNKESLTSKASSFLLSLLSKVIALPPDLEIINCINKLWRRSKIWPWKGQEEVNSSSFKPKRKLLLLRKDGLLRFKLVARMGMY